MNCPNCKGGLVDGMCQTPVCRDASEPAPAPAPARKAVDIMAEHPSIGGRYRDEIEALKAKVAEQNVTIAKLEELREKSVAWAGQQGDTITALRRQVADLQETEPDDAPEPPD